MRKKKSRSSSRLVTSLLRLQSVYQHPAVSRCISEGCNGPSTVPGFRTAFVAPLRVVRTIVDHSGNYFRRTIIKGVPRAALIAKEPISSCSSYVKLNRRRMRLPNREPGETNCNSRFILRAVQIYTRSDRLRKKCKSVLSRFS